MPIQYDTRKFFNVCLKGNSLSTTLTLNCKHKRKLVCLLIQQTMQHAWSSREDKYQQSMVTWWTNHYCYITNQSDTIFNTTLTALTFKSVQVLKWLHWCFSTFSLKRDPLQQFWQLTEPSEPPPRQLEGLGQRSKLPSGFGAQSRRLHMHSGFGALRTQKMHIVAQMSFSFQYSIRWMPLTEPLGSADWKTRLREWGH